LALRRRRALRRQLEDIATRQEQLLNEILELRRHLSELSLTGVLRSFEQGSDSTRYMP
jgi:hypothetical protein